jgi:flagella synthesis protein FlgN
MTKMTRSEAYAKLQDGVSADLDACAGMLALLEQQFECALRHQSARLAELAALLEPALDSMEARRVERLSLVRALLGAQGTMAALLDSLPAAQRARMAADWAELEQRVLACKQGTTRNSTLLAEQYSVMQRVLHGEEQTYAPR